MDLLTFEDVAARAVVKADAATAPDRRAGWERLAQIATELGGGGQDTGVVRGRSWSLIRVEVSGFQGVTTMEPLHIDPTPGVTVLYGPNGSGKSSLAEAIELALRGSVPQTGGRGGNVALWDRSMSCARGAEEAVVRVVLRDGPEELVLSARVSLDGQVEHRAVIETEGGSREIALDETSWSSALATARPVFGYAAVERRVQLAKDLQGFLEPLLGLGTCLDVLKDGLERAARPAVDAFERWEAAREEAQTTVRAVDDRFAAEGEPALAQLRWPDVEDDPAVWLAAAGLSDSGDAVDAVSEADVDTIGAAVSAVGPALGALDSAQQSVLTRLAGPLRTLHRHVAELDDPSTECPVCAAPNPSWTTTLRESVERLAVLSDHEAEVVRRLAAARGALDEELARVAVVLDQEWLDAEVAARAQPARDRAREFRAALDRHGLCSDPAVRSSWRALTDALGDEDWALAAAEAVRQSDRIEQWRRARHAAVASFVATWELDGAAAHDAATWHVARTYCLKALQVEAWRERTNLLRDSADVAVRRLLSDAGLRIAGVTVQATKSDIAILDDAGERVELSMLSAGQRNALLLAPLLAAERAGPFRFLVLDDPVHAFDQLRVDRLAHLVEELARTRRVIVLTHDERLREHLLAATPQHQAHAVRRNAASGALTHDEDKPGWRRLLDDATEAFRLAEHNDEQAAVRPADVVRGFLRMAVDAALRQRVMVGARESGRDVSADLARLDHKSKGTTALRFEAVGTMHPTVEVTEARRVFDVYSEAWNKSAHGNDDAPPFDAVEITDATRVCRLLALGHA